MPKVIHLSTDLWAFGRTHKSGFPIGFVERAMREVYRGGSILHLCCGTRVLANAVNVDIRGDVKPDVLADATRLPFQDESFDFVIADPPYEGYDSRRLYGTEIPPTYSLLEEMSRVTAKGGQYCLLYVYTPSTLGGDCRTRQIAVTMGIHTRPRMFTVWERGLFPGKASHQYTKKPGARVRSPGRKRRDPGPGAFG